MADISENLPASWFAEGPLYLAGEKVDGRTSLAKRYRELGNDLAAEMRNFIAPSEQILLRRAAMLALLCERSELAICEGKQIDEDSYRRNTVALRGALVALGLAAKSRDVKKSDRRSFDAHAQAVLDAVDED